MRRLTARALLFMLALLPAAAAAAGGATFYVNRIVVAGPGDISMGDLVQVSGDVPPEGREALARSVAVMADRILCVPTSWYRPQLEAVFGRGAIIVGSRSTVIPRGGALEAQAYLVDRLIDWLQSQGLLLDARTEIAVTQLNVKGTPPQDGTPAFQALKGARGGTDITVSLSGAGGGSVSGRFFIAAAPPGTDGVKPGTPVNVVFRKGLIEIEVPGKALTAASVGERLSVSITESQKSFSGQLIDGKAVEVDLP